ncbi:CYP2J2: Cytochrome protein, partial [Crotalus adamanteus]
ITYHSLLMPSGIIFSNGHVWKEQRHIGITSLRKLGLGKKSIEHQMEDIAQMLVETFKKTKVMQFGLIAQVCLQNVFPFSLFLTRTGQPFDPSIPVINAVSNIICALSFGHQFEPEDESFQKLIQALEIIVKFSGSFFHMVSHVFR